MDSHIAKVATPLKLPAWRACLRHHPNTDQVSKYILDGLQYGFHIGIEPSFLAISQSQHVIGGTEPQSNLPKETSADNIIGPFQSGNLHKPLWSIILKKHWPGKWRLIKDVSSPKDANVNDAIDPALYSLSYISVDQAATAAMQLGQGALMDIQAAYCLIPVHPPRQSKTGHVVVERTLIVYYHFASALPPRFFKPSLMP